MHTTLAEKLFAEGLLSDGSKQKIANQQKNKFFSVHWELKTILYLGVLLVSTGLGILVYKNIDSIGHQVILIFIAFITTAGFVYCFKTKLPFATRKVEAPNSFFDYILLLASLSFITFIGYLQYQYHFFGDRFGLVTFIPMLVLFFSAYFFDHLGILSMAITNLAAWVGIAVTPLQVLKENNFNNGTIIITALVLGTCLVVTAMITRLRQVKPHFAFTYMNFGIHIIFIATLAGLFEFENIYLLWFLLLAGIAFYFYTEAIRSKSFYLLLVLTLYSYIGLSYVIMHFLFETMNADMAGVYFTFLYFIGSATGLIFFLIRMNKKIKNL